MKKVVSLILIVSFIFTLFVVSASAYNWANPYVTDLMASQHHDVGDVTIWNNTDFLCIKIEMHHPWLRLFQSHVHVATSMEGIPQNNGNPTPGKFDYKVLHDRWETAYLYKIPMDGTWEIGDDLYIAVHVTIEGICGLFATSWAGPFNFPGATWAKFVVFPIERNSLDILETVKENSKIPSIVSE